MIKKTKFALYSATMIIILVVCWNILSDDISIFFENKFQVREDRVFNNTTQRIHYVSDGDKSFNFHNPDFTDISSYIKTNIDHNFDINNYTIHVSNSFETNGSIEFVYTVNGIETNVSYVVIINDGRFVEVASNGDISNIGNLINLPIITDELLETAKSKARRRIDNRHYILESQRTRPIIDVNTNKVYIYVFSKLQDIESNTFVVVSYRYRVQ